MGPAATDNSRTRALGWARCRLSRRNAVSAKPKIPKFFWGLRCAHCLTIAVNGSLRLEMLVARPAQPRRVFAFPRASAGATPLASPWAEPALLKRVPAKSGAHGVKAMDHVNVVGASLERRPEKSGAA